MLKGRGCTVDAALGEYTFGTDAAIAPLILAAILAPLGWSKALLEVDGAMFEAVITMRATPCQVISQAYFPAAISTLPGPNDHGDQVNQLLRDGGFDWWWRFGRPRNLMWYQPFRPEVRVSMVVVLMLIVQAVRFTGDRL